ncbi:MAG TPA: peptidoglycan DD-metalloendopeptidase family protein [Polyangiaceae bacterium]|nr:peptidoglycan DD-metalloendopeptidase family protein [Polyangiaceae bacterium]
MRSSPSPARALGAALVVAAACGPLPLGAAAAARGPLPLAAAAPARHRLAAPPAPGARGGGHDPCTRPPFLTPFEGRLVLRAAYRGAASSEFRFCPRYSGFGPVRAGRFHGGVDLAAPTGTPLRAAVDGTLSYARDPDGYGLYARLAFAEPRRKASGQCEGFDELELVYGHLVDDDPGLDLSPRPVRAGEFLGRVGCSGNARGMCSPSPESHVHVTLKRAGRTRLEPLSVLGWSVITPSDEDRPAGWAGCAHAGL